jgi:hypothetical protein
MKKEQKIQKIIIEGPEVERIPKKDNRNKSKRKN